MVSQLAHEHSRRERELAELNFIRLDKDLSYERLGQLVGVSGKTLWLLLTGNTTCAYDRTWHKIHAFFEAREAARQAATSAPPAQPSA